MNEIAVQLYTMRNVEKSLPDKLKLVADAGYDGVEFAYQLPGSDLHQVTTAPDQLDLSVAGVHVMFEATAAGIDGVEGLEIETVSEICTGVGTQNVVVPYLNKSYFESAEAIEETAELLSNLSAAADEYGLTLYYHNHEQEFQQIDGEFAFHRLAQQTDIPFEFDTGWAAYAGADPSAVLQQYSDRISLVHIKDVDEDTGEATQLGEGCLDLGNLRETLLKLNSPGVIYEYDNATEPVESVNTGYQRLANNVLD